MRRLHHTAGFLALAIAAGCANRNANIRYVHPTRLQRYGREIAVVPFEGPDGADFATLVEQRLQRAGYTITAPTVARMVVTGQVSESEIGQEETGQRPHTCYRQVPEVRTRQVPVVITLPQLPRPTNNPYYVAPPPQTRTEYRTEQYTEMVERPYSCIQLWRSIDARFRVQTWIRTRSRPIQTVDQQVISLADTQTRTGLQGSDSEDHLPPPVNGPGLLASLHERAVNDFAQETTPQPDNVQLELANCHDDRCESGIELVRNGNLEGAARLFDQVVQRYQADNSSSGRSRRAAALFNRGVARGFGDDLDAGIVDVRTAIELDAESAVPWSSVLQILQRLNAERDAATFRGETRLGRPASQTESEPETPRPTGPRPPATRRRPR